MPHCIHHGRCGDQHFLVRPKLKQITPFVKAIGIKEINKENFS
jgi:hypothetical protein